MKTVKLFELTEHGNRIFIFWVYIHRVMQPCGEKTGENPSTVSKNTVTVEAPIYGMSTVTHRIIKNKIEIKIKTSTTDNKAATAADAADAVTGEKDSKKTPTRIANNTTRLGQEVAARPEQRKCVCAGKTDFHSATKARKSTKNRDKTENSQPKPGEFKARIRAVRRNRHFASETVALGANETGS